MKERIVYLICRCGERHLLCPGLAAPVYWCGDKLKELKEDDEVEYEIEEENISVENLRSLS